MPNIEMLVDSISRHLRETQNGQRAYFATIDLKNAYIYLQLQKDTAKQLTLFKAYQPQPIDLKQDSIV